MVDVPEEEMDNAIFRSNTVLSDVHLHCPNKRHLMVRLNTVGQPGNVCLDWSYTLSIFIYLQYMNPALSG